MGKIRVKTIGIEEEEKEQKKKAQQRAEKKRAEKSLKNADQNAEKNDENVIASEAKQSQEDKETAASPMAPLNDEIKPEKKAEKKEKKDKFKKAKVRSSNYLATAKLIDRNKKYTLSEALKILGSAKHAKFDETVELHINTAEKGVSGSLTLPHGTGKKMKVEIADNTNDPKHLQDLIKKIEGGQIDFDILIATPDSMSHLARVARFLGPKGLMPNPKNGTVNPKPVEAAKKFEGGQINFKTEAKAPIIHMTVGKMSFEEKKLEENIEALLTAVQSKNIKSVTLKSTMSPGLKLQI